MVSGSCTPSHGLLVNGKKEGLVFSSDATQSDTTSDTITDPTYFTQPKSLMINARGIGAFRLPLPSSQLEILIFHSDGSLAYLSTRHKVCSGDAILSHPRLGDMLSTSYFFGPGRPPIIRYLQSSGAASSDEIKISGKWTSRAQTFVSPAGTTLEWSYSRERLPSGEKTTLLVLHVKDDTSKGKGRQIAKLVRSDETRTPGSSRSYAGNGGELVIDQDACKGIDEALVVATCLVMLKKEIDRRRALQMMALSAAISAGS